MSNENRPEDAFDLPDGEWAVLRPAKKVPERLRRPVRAAAVALQKLLPEELRNRPVVTVTEDLNAPVVDDATKAAFGAPPIDQLLADAIPVEDPDATSDVLPTDEQQEAADVYTEVLIVAMVASWSFGPVSIDEVRNLPGDAFDALLEECRRLNQGDDGDEESLASDPSTP